MEEKRIHRAIVAYVEARTGRSMLLRKTWSWALVAHGNHETLASSETYSSMEKADETAGRVAHQLNVPYHREEFEPPSILPE